MHKSLGNSIEPEEIIKHHGADLLRLWTASVEFHEDVRVSETILTRLQEAYRKLRNTFRYVLGNLHGFDPRADAVPVDDMLEIDQWILIRAEDAGAPIAAPGMTNSRSTRSIARFTISRRWTSARFISTC